MPKLIGDSLEPFDLEIQINYTDDEDKDYQIINRELWKKMLIKR